MTLRRSSDRKVANTPTNKIKNAFGLPAGQAYSCPGATTVCEGVCYAGKIENLRPAVKALLLDNYNQLVNASFSEMVFLIHEMITDFARECDKKGAPKAFRIHWDGDFFSRTYASAWATVIRAFPDVTFWVYTRSFTDKLNVVDLLVGIPNLAVYLSVDTANEEWASVIVAEYPEIKIAALSDTMANAGLVINEIRGGSRPGAKCPELIGAIPLISAKGGACFACQLCPKGKADIRFSTKKVGGVRV